jgi:hypothetical protein
MIPGLVSPDLGARAGNLNGTMTIRGMNASAVNYAQQSIAAPSVSQYMESDPARRSAPGSANGIRAGRRARGQLSFSFIN